MQLILYRALSAAVIAVVVVLWIYPALEPAQQQLMGVTGLLFLLLLPLQAWMTSSRVSEKNQWAFQYASDTTLASVLIFASGGVFSPFSFLYGLIIIASGSHARRLLPVVMSLLACSGYLSAVYGEAWLARTEGLNTQQALNVLLQVSALILVGGVMAYMARRHASLRAQSDLAVRQHRKLKDLHDQIMAEMAEGVIVLDRDLNVSDMNAAARYLLGDKPVVTLLAIPAFDAFFQQSKLTDFQCEVDGLGNDAGGDSERTFLLAVRYLSSDADAAWLLTIVDISEVRRLELQLVQQEKMALLGNMAAMLAHEIRNPIHTMVQGLEIMAMKPDSRAMMQGILHEETLRLNRLVGIMLDYAKPLQPEPALTYLPEVIRQALMQVEIACREQVCWQCDVDELMLDGDHFRLVLDNLLSNALANRRPESAVEVKLSANDTDWTLSVCNTGELADDIRDKLFEPFVTGRSSGIGLGLATVRQVCSANGWTVKLDAETGAVCFQVSGPMDADMIRLDELTTEMKHG